MGYKLEIYAIGMMALWVLFQLIFFFLYLITSGKTITRPHSMSTGVIILSLNQERWTCIIFSQSEKTINTANMIDWLYHHERWALKAWRKSTIWTVLLCGLSAGMGVTCQHAHTSKSLQTHLLFLQLLKTRCTLCLTFALDFLQI